MQFFKLVGAFAAGSGGQGRKRTADENVDLLAAKSEAFNKGLRGRAFFYVVNASGGTFTAMAVQKDPCMNMNPQFPAYTEALGVKLTDIHAEEISLHAACNLLHRASRSDYIEDDDDVLKTLDLDYMVNRRFSDFCFREDLMDEACRDEIYAKAGRLFTKDCLLPELDRIYAGGSFGKIVGHPVHYLIQTDDAGIRREIIQALLPSLYANRRLQNRRYSAVRFRGEALHGESSAYDQFYKSNAGGTVIVQYSADYGDIDDEDTADGIRDTIEKLCSIAALTARKKGLHLDDQAQEKLASVFETARRQADFGNGRYVRNILEKAKMAQATRLLTQDYESLTQKEITTLCAEDIEMPEIAAPAKQRIGFSA